MRWKLKTTTGKEIPVELYKVEDSSYFFKVDNQEVVLKNPVHYPYSISTEHLKLAVESWNARQWRASSGSCVWTLQPQSFGQASQLGQTQVRSQMPGRIVDICIKEGSQVKAGDKILVMEAMKMENEIRSENDFKVKKIHVQKGQSIESDQVLVEFEN